MFKPFRELLIINDVGSQPCTIDGVNTSCDIDFEVNATASNLHHLAQHYDHIKYEIYGASGAAALIGGPLGAPLAIYLGWEATNVGGLSEFFQAAANAAEMTATGTVTVQRFTSKQTSNVPSIAYRPQNGEGEVFTPISPFTIIAITLLKVR